MTALDDVMSVLDPNPASVEAILDRVSWPTVGSTGVISDTRLADYQHHDVSGREWVAVTEWVRPYTDKVEHWWGPVVDIVGDRFALDVGFVLWVDLGRADVRRVPGGVA